MCTFLEPSYQDKEHFQSPQIIQKLSKNHRDIGGTLKRCLLSKPGNMRGSLKKKERKKDGNRFQLTE